MNLFKSAIAGAASAVGTHYADQAMNPTPYSPTAYYGVAAGGLVGAIFLRNKSPVIAGLLLGIGAGSAYQGYTRTSASGGSAASGSASGLLSSMQNLLSASSAVPRFPITGTIPIHRKSDTARMNAAAGTNQYIVDSRAFNPKVAPYGVISYAMAKNASADPSLANSPNYGVPLKSKWPYGLDADNFAKPPAKAQLPQGSPVDLQNLTQQGQQIFNQTQQALKQAEDSGLLDWLGGSGSSGGSSTDYGGDTSGYDDSTDYESDYE